MSRFTLVSGLFIIGAAIGTVSDFSPGLALVGMAGAFLLARQIAGNQPRTDVRINVLIIALSLLSGFFLQHSQPMPSERYLPKACNRIVEGIVERPPVNTPDCTKLSIRMIAVSPCLCSKASVPLNAHDGVVYATVGRKTRFTVNKGHRLRFAAHIQPKRRHFKTLKPSSKSRPFYTAYIEDHATITVMNFSATSMETWLHKKREEIKQIFRINMQREAAQIAIALSTGQRDSLSPKQLQRFRNTGTAHLTVVSGLHLSILALLTYQLSLLILRRIPPIASQINIHCICSVATIPSIWIFALFTGANPPVVRAAIMVSAVLLARLLYRQTSGAQSLLAAATFLLAHTPGLIMNAGFQLSFASVAGFIIFQGHRTFETDAPYVTYTKEHCETAWKCVFFSIRDYLKKVLWTSFIAFGVTTPFLAWHFQAVPIISPLANLILVPLVSVLLLPLLAISIFLVSAKLPLVSQVMEIANALIVLTEKIADTFYRFALVVNPTNFPEQLAAVAASASLLSILIRRFRIGALFFILCLLGILTSNILSRLTPNSDALIVDFLDVGQGDATVITFPTGDHWLVDAGGTATQSVGRDFIVPVLNQLNISKVDKLILTHPDPDHVAGVPDVLRAIPVGEIWENKQGLEESAPAPYREMHRLAKTNQIPVLAGKSLCRKTQKKHTSIEVIHPCSDNMTYFPWLSFNDNSIVLAIGHGDHRILLPGDLSEEGEKHVLSHKNLPRFDVLKLGHHGSASSTTRAFIQKIQPRYAVASCGFHNSYGFPSDTIRRRLSSQGIRLFSTDEHGWIRVVIGLKKIKFVTQKAFL